MPDILIPHYKREERQNKPEEEFWQRSLRDVRQDNNAPERERVASKQAYRVKMKTRTRRSSQNSKRSKKHSTKRRTEPAMGWVPKPISDAINDIAKREGLTRSKTIKNLLKWAVTQDTEEQHAALLPAIIETAVDRAMSRHYASDRRLQIKNALDISQTRTITTNILGRQPGMTPEKLDKILDKSLDKAKQDLRNSSAHVEEILEQEEDTPPVEEERHSGGY